MKRPIRKKIRKLMNHSNKCKCIVCGDTNVLCEHHINGRDILNSNHPSNLMYPCPSCHAKIHEGIIIIEGWFSTSSGKELLWHYKNKECITGTVSKPYVYWNLKKEREYVV